MIWNPLIVSPGNASPYWCSPFCVSLTRVTVHAQCSLTPYWEILRPLAQFEPFPALGSGIPALVGTRVGTTWMSLKQRWLMTARLAWIYGPRLNMESLVFSSVCHFFSIFRPIPSVIVILLFFFTLPCIWTSVNFFYSLLCPPWIHLYIHSSIHPSLSPSIIQKGMTDRCSHPPIPPSLPGLFLHVHLPFQHLRWP